MASYFLYMLPEEEGATYNNDDKTVEYTIHLTKLAGSIPDFFNTLWEINDEKASEEFVKKTLGTTNIPCGLWNVYAIGTEGIPEKTNIKDQTKLFEFLDENVFSERKNKVAPNSFVCSSTMEFDHEWAFFDYKGFVEKELGTHLQPLIEIDEETKELKVVKDKIQYTAYL